MVKMDKLVQCVVNFMRLLLLTFVVKDRASLIGEFTVLVSVAVD
jgi:hypothetical protein